MNTVDLDYMVCTFPCAWFFLFLYNCDQQSFLAQIFG